MYGQVVFSYRCNNGCWQIGSRCIQVKVSTITGVMVKMYSVTAVIIIVGKLGQGVFRFISIIIVPIYCGQLHRHNLTGQFEG